MSFDQLLFTIVSGGLFIFIIQALVRSIRLVPAQSEFIIERLGKYHMTLKAGFHLLIPFIDKVAYIQDLKEHTINVPAQKCFTKDEIQVEVDGVIYMQVFDSVKASYGITDFQFAAIQLAQTTTRSVIGLLELDRTFEEREMISSKVVSVLEEAASKWGVKILRFEIKNLVPPESVRQSMEKQVTAERNRRAIVQKSVGVMQSLINTSEGIKSEMINRSEGEKQKQINEAQGKAEEILAIGEATAQSIAQVGQAIETPGGEQAIKLELARKYFKSLSKLAQNDNAIIMSGNIINLKAILKELNLD